MESRDQFLPMPRCILQNTSLRFATLAFSLVLAGCNSDWIGARDRAVNANATPPGPNYKADVVAFMHTYLNDPTGVKDAFISEPALRPLEHVDRYTICLRYTARKGYGEPYAASKDSLLLFREGRLDRIIDAAKETCKDAAYQPFPELEQLKR
jgi:hypothetical protein